MAHVLDGRKSGHDERKRGGHRALLAVLPPDGLHGHGILAHGDRNPELGAKIHRHGLHRIEQGCILARMPRGRHPVGGQLHVAELLDARSGNVGDCLPHRHAS